jgi:hypothetical protein
MKLAETLAEAGLIGRHDAERGVLVIEPAPEAVIVDPGAAEHEASVDQAVRERREREDGQTRIQNLEPEPDDEQDLGR